MKANRLGLWCTDFDSNYIQRLFKQRTPIASVSLGLASYSLKEGALHLNASKPLIFALKNASLQPKVKTTIYSWRNPYSHAFKTKAPLKFKVAFSSMFFRDSDEVTTRIPRCSGRLAKVVETATGPSSLASHGSGGGARSSERV